MSSALHDKIEGETIQPLNVVPEWVMPLVKFGALTVDAALTVACFMFAFAVRENQPILSDTAWAWSKQFVPYAGILFFAVPARLVMLIYVRSFRFTGAFSYLQEIIKVLKAVAVSSLLIVAWAFLFRGGFAFREFSYSRSIFVADFLFTVIAITCFHLILRMIQVHLRDRGINLIPTLVVGTNSEARQTIAELSARRYLGYRVLGLVGSDVDRDITSSDLDNGDSIPVIGHVDQLAEHITRYRIQEVIITDNSLENEKLFDAMMQVGRGQRVEFRFAPSLFNVLPKKTSIEQIGVLPMVRLFREPLSDVQRFLKRLSDISIAVMAIVLSTPLWVLAAILVKSSSKGPILFKQERVGMDGRVFLCLKFRTMFVDSTDDIHKEAYRKNIQGKKEANSGSESSPVYGKVRNDPRITKFGKWLRMASIDELPQLLNVLRGDMSIVGPRPPIPYEVEEYDIKHRKRLDMKPGITGLWQVSGRNRLTFDDMIRVDLYYIENWSLLLDLKIIFLTLPAVFRGDGAR